MTWRNKFLTVEAKTIEEMVESLESAVEELREMQAEGVTLMDDGSAGDDYARLVTNDAAVAEKFGFETSDVDYYEDDDDSDDDDVDWMDDDDEDN